MARPLTLWLLCGPQPWQNVEVKWGHNCQGLQEGRGELTGRPVSRERGTLEKVTTDTTAEAWTPPLSRPSCTIIVLNLQERVASSPYYGLGIGGLGC